MKYIICVLLFCSWQPIPKWKWTAHWKETHGSTGLGMQTMKSTTKYFTKSSTDSASIHAFFWYLIRHRNHPDVLDIGGEPEIKRNVRIDSVAIK